MVRTARRERPAAGTGSPLRRTAGAALALTGALFLLPLFTVSPLDAGAGEGGGELPTGTLPIQQAAQNAAGARDGARTVKLLLADGTVSELSMSDYLFGVVAAEMPAAFE